MDVWHFMEILTISFYGCLLPTEQALLYKPHECMLTRNFIIILLRVCQTNGN